MRAVTQKCIFLLHIARVLSEAEAQSAHIFPRFLSALQSFIVAGLLFTDLFKIVEAVDDARRQVVGGIALMIKALEIDCFADYKSIDILAVTLTVHFHP
jgi:hypothetical protein